MFVFNEPSRIFINRNNKKKTNVLFITKTAQRSSFMLTKIFCYDIALRVFWICNGFEVEIWSFSGLVLCRLKSNFKHFFNVFEWAFWNIHKSLKNKCTFDNETASNNFSMTSLYEFSLFYESSSVLKSKSDPMLT